MDEIDFLLHCKNTTIKGQAERITELTNQLAQAKEENATLAERLGRAKKLAVADSLAIREKDAEIERLRLVEDELEKKFENTFLDLNLEIERLQKIADACEWHDTKTHLNGVPMPSCYLCERIQGTGHTSDCPYFKDSNP